MRHPLEKFRTRHAISYQALGALIGCSRTQAFQWCKGRALPRPAFADRIQAATGISCARLYRAQRRVEQGHGRPTRPRGAGRAYADDPAHRARVGREACGPGDASGLAP